MGAMVLFLTAPLPAACWSLPMEIEPAALTATSASLLGVSQPGLSSSHWLESLGVARLHLKCIRSSAGRAYQETREMCLVGELGNWFSQPHSTSFSARAREEEAVFSGGVAGGAPHIQPHSRSVLFQH